MLSATVPVRLFWPTITSPPRWVSSWLASSATPNWASGGAAGSAAVGAGDAAGVVVAAASGAGDAVGVVVAAVTTGAAAIAPGCGAALLAALLPGSTVAWAASMATPVPVAGASAA
ncbi:protein of unknown function [Paraburkholderia kururiensis]